MTLPKSEQEKIGETAALLLIRSEQEGSQANREELDSFVRSSVHHVRELLLVQAVSTELDNLDPQRQIDIDSLPVLPELPATLRDERNSLSPATARIPANRWALGLAAAMACVVIGGISWLMLSAGTHSYSTAVGEQRAVKLPDGSIMTLNTASRAEVLFSEKARQIRLLDGEALFAVERDSARPFEVLTDSGVVKAVGTQFNVYRRMGVTRVSVVEGIVQISLLESGGALPPRLKAGEEAEITRSTVARAAQPDVTRALSWRNRKLAFKDAALEDVAREFNRYNSVHLSIEGEPLRRLQVSGVFDADDVQPIIDFVAETPDLRIEVARGKDEIIVRQR